MKQSNIIIFVFIFYIFDFISGFAQTQDSWIIFTTEDGLSDNTATSIIEDTSGVIWVGTENGLNSYQNYQWTILNTSNCGIIDNSINTIYEDNDGSLWFGTKGGVCHLKNNQWTSFTKKNSGLVHNNVQAICRDSNGKYWFGTDGGGVSQFQNNTWVTYDTTNGLASNHVMSIYEDRSGILWFGTEHVMGTERAGLGYFDNGQWGAYGTLNSGLAENSVWSIYEDQEGVLWFGCFDVWGTSKGGITKRFPDGSWEIISPNNSGISDFSVTSILKDSDGGLWFGHWTNGISYLKDNEWKNYTTSNSNLPFYFIESICEDNSRRIWCATHGGGVCFLPLESIWTTFDTTNSEIGSNMVKGIAEDSLGAIWFVNQRDGQNSGGGITKYYNGIWENYNKNNSGLPTDNCASIFISNDGTIWVGHALGVTKIKENEWYTYNTNNSGLADNIVRAITQDSKSAMWFGTRYGGISRFHRNTWTTYNTKNCQLVNDVIDVIYESNDHLLWIGTWGGVNILKDNQFLTIDTINRDFANYGCWSICEDTEGSMWFTTHGGGVFRLKNSIWENFSTENSDLISNEVWFVMKDSKSALWFGTNNGICRYENDLWGCLNNGNCRIAGNEINYILEDKNESYWIATWYGGVSRYLGDKIPPTIKITESPPKTVGIQTPFFSYMGKDFQTENEKITYSYAVANQKENPNDYFSPFNYATYVDTPPLANGNYKFHIRARDKMGNISQPATHAFTIDINSPTVTIEYPKYDQIISGIVPIKGTVYDDSPIQDFSNYNILYGKDSEENEVTRWDTLVYQVKNEIRNDTLAIWDTQGLSGSYRLKLFAKDSLGHEKEDIIAVQIVDIIDQIKDRQGGYLSDALNNINIYFPPNSLGDDIEIQVRYISNLKIEELTNDRFQSIGLAYDIMPEELHPRKPGTLSITYSDSNLINISDEKRLSIFKYDETADDWLLIGGTVDEGNNQVSTTIKQLGRYGVFENLSTDFSSSLTEINCQPRVFSPRGGGYDVKTTVSFNLGKSSNVAVKIYNLSGRLKKVVVEGEYMNAGMNVVDWDGRDKDGNVVPSGLYIVTIEGDGKYAKKTVSVLNK